MWWIKRVNTCKTLEQGLTQSKHSVNAGDGEKDDFSNGSNDGDGEDDVDVMIMNIKGFSMFLS